MLAFVAGATGFIGFAIVKELIGAGHQVTGLARSEASGKKLIEAGWAPSKTLAERQPSPAYFADPWENYFI